MAAISNVAPDVLDTDSAAQLLSSLCPDFIKNNTEVTLGSPESFARLLFLNKNILEEVEQSRTDGNFDGLWENCLRLARPRKPHKSSLRGNEVPRMLNRISSNLRNLVNGSVDFPYWTLKSTTLPDVVTLDDLDSLLKKHALPRMLFHDLGGFQGEPTLRKRVAYLFQKHRNTFLVNASATGKTRLLYEGLCKNWGLYFTAHVDDEEAKTLHSTLQNGFTYEYDFVRRLPKTSALSFNTILAKNREIAHRRFSVVLLVHFLVFRDFLKTATSERGEVGEDLRPRWLLAQVWQRCLRTYGNVYGDLLGALVWESSTYINERLANVLEEVRVLLPESIKTEGLFIVIDEANVAITQLWRSDQNDTETYPALREIINLWTNRLVSLDVPITFVVAGTEIPTHYFPPSSTQWDAWRWSSNTGAFDDPELQKNYLSSLLPLDLMETASGQALIQRIWNWCRPRHRLTASLIAMLLQDQYVHPHATFNKYIDGLTSYQAHDGDEFTATEGQCEILPFFSSIGKVAEFSPRVQFTVHEVIFHYIITGKHPRYFDISKVELVTSGVGQFIDDDMQVIALNQPAPTIASATWLSRSSRSREEPHSLTSFKDFCSYYQGRWPNGDTYVASNYIAFYLAHVFANGRALGDVFTIPSLPSWLTDPLKLANLVILQKDQRGDIHEMILQPSALLPTAPPLGFVASTADDVLAWLNHERVGAFCLCPSECGAELIFILRFNQKNLWVLLRTVGQGAQNPPSIDFYHEFGHLTTKDLFPSPDVETLSDRLLNAFDGLPNSVDTRGSLSILRVLASFPSESALTRNVAQRIKVPPVATLNATTFESITEAIKGADIVETLISSMQDKRDSFTDEMFSSPPSSRSTLMVKSPPRHSKTESASSVSPPRSRSRSSRTKEILSTAAGRAERSASTPELPGSVATIRETRSRVTLPTASRQGEAAASSRLVQRASPGSPKPYAKVKKNGTGTHTDSLSSVEHPSILRRSPREHKVSSTTP